MAGLLALRFSQPGQMRKQAATTKDTSAGGLARHFFSIKIKRINVTPSIS